MNNEHVNFIIVSTNEKGKVTAKNYNYKELLENENQLNIESSINLMNIQASDIDPKDVRNQPLINELEKRNKTRITESAIIRNRQANQRNARINDQIRN